MFNFTEKNLLKIPFVVLDTETTGLHLGLGDRIIEVGAIRYEQGQAVAHFNQVVNPGRMLPENHITGIQNEELQKAPTFNQLVPDLLAFCEGALLVAHNATFDAAFLGLELWLATPHKYPPRQPILPNPWLCTLLVARACYNFGHYSLEQLVSEFKVNAGRAHRAYNDAYTTAEVVKKMNQQLAKTHHLHTVGDFLYVQRGAIYTPPPPELELPELITEAIAKQKLVEVLYLAPDGEMSHQLLLKYAVLHQTEPHIIAQNPADGTIHALELTRLFGIHYV